jgi:hypothetical protein
VTVLEQEIASIIKFTSDAAGNPAPYYWDVPRSVAVPAVYFPSPDIGTGGDTLATYKMEYDWFIKFFHKTTEDAYALGLKALTALKVCRNLVPLIDTEGKATGRGIRIDDPELKKVDDGAVQLKITFTSRRPYNRPDVQKMQTYHIEEWEDSELYESKYVDAAMEAALEKYINKED